MQQESFKFALKYKVKIKEINAVGLILGQRTYGQGPEYDVRYFMNGEAKNCWLYEDEIE